MDLPPQLASNLAQGTKWDKPTSQHSTRGCVTFYCKKVVSTNKSRPSDLALTPLSFQSQTRIQHRQFTNTFIHPTPRASTDDRCTDRSAALPWLPFQRNDNTAQRLEERSENRKTGSGIGGTESDSVSSFITQEDLQESQKCTLTAPSSWTRRAKADRIATWHKVEPAHAHRKKWHAAQVSRSD